MVFVFVFHIFCVSIVRSLCFRIESSSFFITFLYPETARSKRIHVTICLITDYFIRFIVIDGSVYLHCSFHNMFTLPSFQNMFTAILLSFQVKLMKLQISCDEGNSLYHSSSLLLNIIAIDIFVNCNCFDTRWQQYSTYLHTNNT